MLIKRATATVILVLLGMGMVRAAEPDRVVLKHLDQLNAEVESAYERGDYEKGIEIAQTAAAYAERELPAEDPLLATVLNNLALLYHYDGDYAHAEPLYQRSLSIREKALGPDHPDVAQSLHNLAELYRAKGDYNHTEPLYRRALAIAEKALGPDHPNVAIALNNLAGLYRAKGDYGRAEPLYRRARAIAEKVFGPDHPNVATTLNNLALLYQAKGDYARAEQLYQRALAIWEETLGPEHPNLATALNNLAGLYREKGDYARAEPLYQHCLAIMEKALGFEHPRVAANLNNLASIYQAKGDYARAEPLYQRSLAIREKALGPEHPDVATALNNLALLYYNKADYTRAEPLYQRALAIWEKAVGSEHPRVAASLNNLAPLYQAKGHYDRAELLFRRSLGIMENALGPEHRDVAAALNNLAEFYRAKGDYAHAEPPYQRALAIAEKALGPDHPDVASALNNLALLYQAKGDSARAEPLYQRSLAIMEKALVPNHPNVARSLNSLAVLHWEQGDTRQAIALETRAGNIEQRNLSLILATGSESQKHAYAETLSLSTQLRMSLHLDAAPQNPEAARLALITLLQRKGRVLDALTEEVGSLRARLTPEDAELLDQLMAVRSQLAKRVNQGPGNLEPEVYRKQFTELETEADRLEGTISARSAEFRIQSQQVTLDRVQQSLPADTALVELAVYRPFNPKAAKVEERSGASRYAAYVLFPDGEPKWAALGEAQAINQAVEALRGTLRTPGSRPRSRGKRGQVLEGATESRGSANPAHTVDELVIRPIRKLLGDTRTLFFSPDGALNLIPIGALVDENGHYLIEDYHFIYLTSGRDLLRLQLERDAKGNALVLADPDFGARGGKLDESAAGDSGRRSADLSRGKIEFSPLPGTAQEAKAIAPLLGTQPLTRARATEYALKQVHQPAVLHIATHGFFLPDLPEEPKPPIGPGFDRSGPLPAPRTENPLLRSGLALAGANQLRSGNEDGILTALEASSLDLWGTQLVVLSACETGVGKVQNGEGVYGLRRALVNAGTETQVMSLWKVDDAATRDLMVDYYRRLKADEGRSEALRQAQLAMLHTKDHSHPYYWASFIVSGDWRPLHRGPGTPTAGSIAQP